MLVLFHASVGGIVIVGGVGCFVLGAGFGVAVVVDVVRLLLVLFGGGVIVVVGVDGHVVVVVGVAVVDLT